MNHLLTLGISLLLSCLFSCGSEKNEQKSTKDKAEKEFFIVPGEDEEVDPELIKKGQVLIAYSDCYQCHKEEDKAKGPSFSDIARRYPMRTAIIEMLGRKIIAGGSGTWGYPVMSPHPMVSLEDAQIMVTYVLSLEDK